MRLSRSLIALGVGAVLVLSACADDTDTTPAMTERPEHAFDEVRHIVLEQHDTDAHEIVTAIAHLCSVGDTSCPDGREELIVLGSHTFLPHDAHLYDPDTVLKPPAECLADGTYCLLSVSHCEFATATDMEEAGHCVPEGTHFVQVAAGLSSGEHHECIDPEAEMSRHVDMDCLRDTAELINEPTTGAEEADS